MLWSPYLDLHQDEGLTSTDFKSAASTIPPQGVSIFGTEGRTRTGTPLRALRSKRSVSTIPPLRLVNVVRLSGLEPENLSEQALEACAFTISPQTHIWSDVTESNRYSWICSPEPNHSANAAYLVLVEGIAPTRPEGLVLQTSSSTLAN